MSQLPDSAIGEALKNHFDLTTTVLDSVDALITVTDPEGRILFFNSACEQLSGYSREEMKGKRIWDILLDSDKKRVKALFSIESVPANYTATWVTRTGAHQPIYWSYTAQSATGIDYWLSTGTLEREADRERWRLEADLRQIEDRLRHVVEYQTLLQRLLLNFNHFINIDAAEVERGISQSLQAIAEFTGSDRSYLYQVQDDTLRCLSHCCLNLWNPTNDECDQTLLISNFPWVWSQIQQLNPVSVSCINDLPPEAAAFQALCDRHNIQSVLLVPLVFRLQLFGFIGLEVHSPKVWSEEDISSIKLVGDIFINALERQQFEQELQEKHRLLHTVVNTTTDAIFVKDLQGRYLLANQINSYIMGKPLQEIIGQDDTALFPAELAAKIQEIERQVIASGIPQTLEKSILIDGELKTYLSSKSVYRDADGKAIGIIGVSKEITPQKTAQRLLEQANERLEQNVRERIAELQQVNRQLQYHLDNTPLAVIEWDRDMRIKRWSPKAAEIFGWTEAEVLGKHPQEWEIIHRDDLEMVEQAIAQFFEQEKTCYIVVNRNYTKSGAVIYCEWYNSVSFDEFGQPLSVLSLIQNVTKRKRAEADLKESESRLRLFIANAPRACHQLGKLGKEKPKRNGEKAR